MNWIVELFELMLSGFWKWVGSVVILSIIFGCLSQIRLFEINKSVEKEEREGEEDEQVEVVE